MVKLVTYEKSLAQNRERLATLLTAVSNEKHPLCDVLLRVPVSDGSDAWKVIGSNSTFLRAISSVFEALWTSDSSKQDVVDTVDIADCSVEAVNAMNALAFGCFEQVDINERNIGELLYAATKYDIGMLADACEQWIEDVIADAQYAPGFFLTTLFALQTVGLSAMATDKMVQKIDATNVTPLFMCKESAHLPLAVFRKLLKSDDLKLKETVVWEQCVEWAKLDSERSQDDDGSEEIKLDDDSVVTDEDANDFVAALRPLKEFIRFTRMPLEFFLKKVSMTGLLSDGQIVQVCQSAVRSPPTELFCRTASRNRGSEFMTVDKLRFVANEETIRVIFDFQSFDDEPIVTGSGAGSGWIGLVPASVCSRDEKVNDAADVHFFPIHSLFGEGTLLMQKATRGQFEIRAFTRDDDGTQIGEGIPITTT